jgi:hypothetical protein
MFNVLRDKFYTHNLWNINPKEDGRKRKERQAKNNMQRLESIVHSYNTYTMNQSIQISQESDIVARERRAPRYVPFLVQLFPNPPS